MIYKIMKPYSSLGEFGHFLIGAGTGFLIADCLLYGDKSCLMNLIRMFIPEVE
jgi:hypothetical protein